MVAKTVTCVFKWRNLLSQLKLLYLLPWFQPSPSARRRLTGSFTDPISGPLAVLPTEVLGAIVAALLELKPGAPQCLVLASAHWLCNFLRTCRGAAAAVSRAQLLDAVARIHVGLTPMPGAEPDRAYYTLSLSHMRSVMEITAMLIALKRGVSHCASVTGACCRGARIQYNHNMRSLSHFGVDPTTDVGALALEAMGSGRTRMCAAVAGGNDTLLLCQTDRGAAICSRRSYVRCVEAHSLESPLVYSPDGELATAFHKDLEEGDLVVMGASGGDLLVLLMARRTALESGGGEGVQHELHTWDMTTNTLLDTRQCGSVDLLWVRNDVVYRLGSTDREDAENQYSASIYKFQPRGAPAECLGLRWTMPRISRHRTLCTSRLGGHLAMVNPSTQLLAEEIMFVDVEMALFATVHPNPNLRRSEDCMHSLIELSPAGDTMVYIGRALANSCVSIYRRDPRYINHRTASKDFEEDELLGWSRTHSSTQASNSIFSMAQVGLQVRVNSAFSPCGGRVYFVFDFTHGSECMIIDLRTTFHPHTPSNEIAITAHKVFLGCQPKAIVWSSDGIYLQTNFASGVVRIGSL